MENYYDKIIGLLTDWVNDRNCLNDNGEFKSPDEDKAFDEAEKAISKLAELID